MYIPAAFQEQRPEVLSGLITAHPLGLLVTHGSQGLQASPLPFHLQRSEGDACAETFGVLRAHFARANSHWKELLEPKECLVVFQGANSYVTPSWYATKAATHEVVPTWNYLMVQAWGTPTLHEDAEWLLRHLTQLTHANEAERPAPWTVTDAPSEFIAKQMRGIIGLEIRITRIEGKWKTSQNRNEADRAGVIAGMTEPADPHYHPEMARIVEERGRPPS